MTCHHGSVAGEKMSYITATTELLEKATVYYYLNRSRQRRLYDFNSRTKQVKNSCCASRNYYLTSNIEAFADVSWSPNNAKQSKY